jgi:hypothetical protein
MKYLSIGGSKSGKKKKPKGKPKGKSTGKPKGKSTGKPKGKSTGKPKGKSKNKHGKVATKKHKPKKGTSNQSMFIIQQPRMNQYTMHKPMSRSRCSKKQCVMPNPMLQSMPNPMVRSMHNPMLRSMPNPPMLRSMHNPMLRSMPNPPMLRSMSNPMVRSMSNPMIRSMSLSDSSRYSNVMGEEDFKRRASSHKNIDGLEEGFVLDQDNDLINIRHYPN